MGPIEVLVLTFPRVGLIATIAPVLADLVASGALRVVDALIVTRGDDGQLVIADLDDSLVPTWSTISPDPRPMFSSTDAELAGATLDASSAAIVVAVENLWSRRLADRASDSGGVLDLHARIDPVAVASAERVDA